MLSLPGIKTNKCNFKSHLSNKLLPDHSTELSLKIEACSSKVSDQTPTKSLLEIITESSRRKEKKIRSSALINQLILQMMKS